MSRSNPPPAPRRNRQARPDPRAEPSASAAPEERPPEAVSLPKQTALKPALPAERVDRSPRTRRSIATTLTGMPPAMDAPFSAPASLSGAGRASLTDLGAAPKGNPASLLSARLAAQNDVDALLRPLEALREQLAELHASLESERARGDRAQAEVEQQRRRAEQQQQERERSASELSAARAELDSARRELERSAGQVRGLEAQLGAFSALSDRAHKLDEENQGLRLSLEGSRSQLSLLQKRLEAVTAAAERAVEAAAGLRDAEAEAAKQRAGVERAQQRLREESDALARAAAIDKVATTPAMRAVKAEAPPAKSFTESRLPVVAARDAELRAEESAKKG